MNETIGEATKGSIYSADYPFLGRRVIYTSRPKDKIDENTIPDIVNGAMLTHRKNRTEILYLYDYFKGKQPILKRVKVARKDVNNKIVFNNAFSIVRNAVGYFLGEPIQYTVKKQEDSDKITQLNDYMDSENKAYEDMSLGNFASICGTSYRLVTADVEGEEDEAPFEIPTLEPWNTFVIYSTTAGHKPVLGVTYYSVLDDNGNTKGTHFTVYDDDYQYEYETAGVSTSIKSSDLLTDSPKPHFLGAVPIVEYPNNEWRIGDFEVVMRILDGINKVQSDRVNAVEQIVSAILVFKGLHLKTAKENKNGVSDYDTLRDTLTLEIPSDGKNDNHDVFYVTPNLNQDEVETLAQTMIDYVYAISGIPDRKERSNGGGDTGDAVYLRDGFQSLEVVARVKERNFRRSERRTLRLVCQILKHMSNMDLKPMQIDIKFIRNRTNNLLNKSQAAANLVKSRLFAPESVISLIGVTDDPKGMAELGMEYQKSLATNTVNTEKINAQANTEVDNQNGENSTETSQNSIN